MKNLLVSFRSFFKGGKNNLIRILSLAVGLAMGLVLIAMVYYEQTFDNFFPDNERIYMIYSNYSDNIKAMEPYGMVSGAIAPGMKAEIPEVEAATRYWLVYGANIVTPDKKKYAGNAAFADPYLFDVLQRPILAGDPIKVLSEPMKMMVSSEIAERMGGIEAVMNKVVEVENYPGRTLTIGGVFESLPLNTHLRYDFCVSILSVGQFMYDGSMNWAGNDGYRGYVKLRPGTDPQSLAPAIRAMQVKHQSIEKIEERGIKMSYTLYPLVDIHKKSPEVKERTILLSLLAFAILFAAIMNYVLIVISSLVNRAKEMAVNKCYGASNRNIYNKMMIETIADMFMALLLGIFLIFVFRGMIQTILGTSLVTLLNTRSILLLAGVCVVIFLIAAIVPANLYSRIPVATAFRRFNETRRYWKFGLLFLQFLATGFFATLLLIISQQYNFMVKDNPGYNYQNLGYCNARHLPSTSRQSLMEELSSLPEIEKVATASSLLMSESSGNDLRLPGKKESLFNIQDLYNIGNQYLDFMEIPVIEGVSFQENVSSSHEVMISRSCRDMLLSLVDWQDGVIGKGLYISEHSKNPNDAFTICGVYEDIRTGVIGSQDTRPSIMFYSDQPQDYVLFKYIEQTPEAAQKVAGILERMFPDREMYVYSYTQELIGRYNESKLFRDQVLVGGLLAILITIIGLIGYTNDEMNRRKKETAIRKVNGATIKDILLLFLRNISWMAIPALILGAAVASYIAVKIWLVKFADKADLSPLLFITSIGIVLIIILSVVSLNCYKTARENPADTVKAE